MWGHIRTSIYISSVLHVGLLLLLLDRYDLLHNAHLNLDGLDELFKVAQVN